MTDLTKLTSHTVGSTQIQTSEGTPNHISLLGTQYNDSLTGIWWRDTDGVSAWVYLH
jgi:hypothetical protein